jgi:SAM-dependent methyltransferase|tara:strand:+ start:15219 stop:16475 length:1257 start_codon:yes stop_codon:yes gene_type:complete
MSKCRVSKDRLETIIDFGNIYLNNFVKEKNNNLERGKLRIGFSKKSKLVQLLDTADQDKLYRQYWYRSGTNETMTNQLYDIVDNMSLWAELKEDDIVLDIGCNDGTLLKRYDKYGKFFKVGIDPATNVVKEVKKQCDAHAVGFFSEKVFKKLVGNKKAKTITSIAMYYDLDDPLKFTKDIFTCLDDKGIWILQVSYTPLMINLNAFDNVIHEHIEYYTLTSIKKILDKCNFEIVDAQLNDVNAGSLRIIAKKRNNKLKNTASFIVEMGKIRLKSLLDFEKNLSYDKKSTFLKFKKRVDFQKKKLVDLLKNLKKKKKKVYGYGASTKGNTLLQYYKINEDLISGIAERQPQKIGLKTVGSWIPIISEEEMRKIKPDYMLVLPWQFIHEFIRREKKYLKEGGKFIVPLPEVKIIGKEYIE